MVEIVQKGALARHCDILYPFQDLLNFCLDWYGSDGWASFCKVTGRRFGSGRAQAWVVDLVPSWGT